MTCRARLLLTGLALVAGSACGGGDTGGPTPPPPPPPPPAPVATVEVTPAARTLAVGETVQLSATPRSAAGTSLGGRTATWLSDQPTTASVSDAGLVTAAGPGSATISATIEGRVGTAVITVTPPLPSPSCRQCLELVPGNLILPAVGAQQQLSAFLVDAGGARTAVTATFTTSRPGVATVSSTGLVTATGLGSVQVTAQGGGRTSAPLLVLVAAPVAGTVLVSDDRVERAPAPVNAQADFGAGYRYTIRIRGAPPVVGQMMSGTGSLPILGRVERVTPAGTGLTEVELEVRPLKEIFPNLSLNETWDLEVPATAAGFGSAPTDRPPGMVVQRPLKDGEFLAGPFTCKVEAGVALTIPLGLQVEAIEVVPDLRAELIVIDGEVSGVAVRGELRPRFILTPRVQVAIAASLTCKVILYELPIPVPGPLALVIKPEVPVGLGFKIGGTLPAQTGARVGIEGSASIAAAWACSNGACVDVTNNNATLDGIFEPLVGGPATGQVDLAGSAFAFAGLEVTNPVAEQLAALKIKLLDVQAGIRQRITVASTSVQAASPTYASGADLTLFTEATSEVTASLAGLWQLQAWKRSTSDSLLLASTPRGFLQVNPTSVAPGTVAQPGDTALFRVVLNNTTWLTLEAVEGVEIFWSTPQGLVSVCGFMEPERPMQSEYECRLTVLEEHVGSQHFYAFVTAKIYGLPFATPFEVGPDSKVTVQVRPPLSGETVYFSATAQSTLPVGCRDEKIQQTGTSASLSAQAACSGGGGDFVMTSGNTSTVLGGRLTATAARGATTGFSSTANAGALAQVDDVVVISVPGLEGTQGSFAVGVGVVGTMTVTGPCSNLGTPGSLWEIRGELNPAGVATQQLLPSVSVRGGITACTPGGTGTPLPAGVSGPYVTFTFGVPFRLKFQRAVGASVGGVSSGAVPAWSAAIDVTFRWLGMTGLPLDATLTSASGVDWSKPAPP